MNVYSGNYVYPFGHKGQQDQNYHDDELELFWGKNRWSVNGSNSELCFDFDKLAHGFGEARKITCIHLYSVGFKVFCVRTNQANVRDAINTELGEGGLRFSVLDITKKELGLRWGIVVVGDEWGGKEGEFVFEVFEVELGFGVELVSVEEDEEGEGAG